MARIPGEDRLSCSSGLLSRNTVEVAQRTEPDECVDRVGDGGRLMSDEYAD